MKRFIEAELEKWKTATPHLPLIIRGARQVGKSFTVEKFGQENFKTTVTINFEFQPTFANCFDTLDPEKIISKIELATEKDLIDGESLLFLDEIQQCPNALKALRYFKEKRPNLHVIAAGSLLEFALKEEDFSFPVGRVEFLYMRPLSFNEYLYNLGNHKLLNALDKVSLTNPLDQDIHNLLIKYVREYLLIGGMPSVVNKYIESKSYLDAHRLQSGLLESYRNDFGKYASNTQFKYLQRFFEKAPLVVGQVFKYVNIDREARPRDLKTALEQLCYTGLINKVYNTNANGIPLQSEINDTKFKLIFLDIGLMQNANKINPESILNDNVWQNEGALAEQFVGQELLANGNYYENKHLYFWARDKGAAEVDYISEINFKVVPIEVKAGKDGRTKSLNVFMKEKETPYGIKISQSPLEVNHTTLNVPFYLLNQLPRLLKELN